MADKTAEKKDSPKKKAIDGLMEIVDNLEKELNQTPYPLTRFERNAFTHSLLGFHAIADEAVIQPIKYSDEPGAIFYYNRNNFCIRKIMFYKRNVNKNSMLVFP